MTGFEEGVLTLNDESTDTTIPSELLAEFEEKWAAFTAEPAEGEEAPPEKVPIWLSVNKTKKTIIAFAEPPAKAAEEAGE